MNTVRDEALSDEAIAWLVRLGSGHANAADRAAFASWRARSTAHEAAATEAEAILHAVGATRHAVGFQAAPAPVAPVVPLPWRFSRRAVVGGAIAASAAGVLAGAGVFGPVARLYSDYATGVGERRRVALPDGSVAWLNTDSALSVAYTDTARQLALHAGEAMFEVARDSARPFTVAAAGGATCAVGTIFAVRRGADDTDVTVTEGIVEVSYGVAAPVRVMAGQRLAYGRGGLGPPEAADTESATAWQRGKLIFNRQPLGVVVAELQRYQTASIVITDARLSTLQVTGVFDLDDPDLLLRTVARATGARLFRLPLLTLLR